MNEETKQEQTFNASFVGRTMTDMANGTYTYAVPPPETTVRDDSRFTGRRITIQPLHHGYHVEVGCQSFAIEDKNRLCDLLHKYLQDPAGVENLWLGSKFLPS
jgi:hypothetical protein